MATEPTPPNPSTGNINPATANPEFGAVLATPLLGAVGLGVVGCVVSLLAEPQQFLFSYLTAYTFTLTIVLGMLIFVLIQHVTDSGWSIVVRRPAEQFLSAFPLLAILFLPIAIGLAAGSLHPWVTVEEDAKATLKNIDKHLDGHKTLFLGYGEPRKGLRAVDPGEVLLPPELEDKLDRYNREGYITLDPRSDRDAKLIRLRKYEEDEKIHKIHDKSDYLNVPFFLLRCAFYFGSWLLLTWFFRGGSLAQDKTGDPTVSLAMRRWAAPSIYLFALTTTFFAFDVLMSLDYMWYSTIFGVYIFAGGFVAACALLGIIASVLTLDGTFTIRQADGSSKNLLPTDRLHDIGKMMFAFSVFYAYVTFSQFFLIWYGDIPEETIWFRHRWHGDWPIISTIMPILRFPVPFVVLLSAGAKRTPMIVIGIGAVMLLAHYLDHFFLVMPTYRPEKLLDAGLLANLAALLAVAGGTALWVLQSMQAAPLYPIKDPRLAEALAEPHHHHDDGHAGSTSHSGTPSTAAAH